VEKAEDKEITDQLTRLASRWKRFGYRRLHVMLQRENIHINHKRTYRLYKEAGLTLKRRNKKKKGDGILFAAYKVHKAHGGEVPHRSFTTPA
jgi:transposase InsO family protein